MDKEEVAFRIVRLYFEDIARLGFKRQLDLDQMINAYFYTLKKLDEPKTKVVCEEVPKENNSTTKETKTTKTKTETQNQSNNNNQNKESVTDIIES